MATFIQACLRYIFTPLGMKASGGFVFTTALMVALAVITVLFVAGRGRRNEE